MAATVVTSPFSSILDLSGQGLTLGSLYIGAPNTDPQVNPQAVYWDAALTQAAAQPLQVSAGYIMRLGTPSAAFTAGDYSIRALDHLGVQVFYRATNVSDAPPSIPGRTFLTANTDLYVATTGSDATGTGTAGNPWKTIQKAFNVLQASYDLAGFVATIHVGAGTFGGAAMSGAVTGAAGGTGSIPVLGNGEGSTIVQGAAGAPAFGAAAGAAFFVGSMTIGGAGGYGLAANLGGVIAFGAVTFGAVTTAHLYANSGGQIICAGSYGISGGAAEHFFAFSGSSIGHFGGPFVCTLTGAPAFSAAFAAATDNGVLEVQSSWLTFSGSATGPRYVASTNATINTFASGASYFPGSSAGSVSNNGIYV